MQLLNTLASSQSNSPFNNISDQSLLGYSEALLCSSSGNSGQPNFQLFWVCSLSYGSSITASSSNLPNFQILLYFWIMFHFGIPWELLVQLSTFWVLSALVIRSRMREMLLKTQQKLHKLVQEKENQHKKQKARIKRKKIDLLELIKSFLHMYINPLIKKIIHWLTW